MHTPGTGAGQFTTRERANLRFRSQIELLPEFLRVLGIPVGIECLRVAHEFANAHPARKIAVFGELADA